MNISSLSAPRSAIHRILFAVCAAALFAIAPELSAQIGHRPDDSPYQDVKVGQTLSGSAGWLFTKRDPAGVAPEPSAFGQLRYDIAVGGPAFMYARYMIAPSKRAELLPGVLVPDRLVGNPGTTMHVMDAGIDIALTGRKSWHNLVPSLAGGVGIVSDFASADTGTYQFGVKFALTYGLGMRYIHSSGTQLRVEATNYIWQYDYPDRFFATATDGTAILSNTNNRSAWRGNWGLSAGLAFPIFR